MNRLVKKVLQMYIGIEWNSMDEFDGWHPAKFLHTLCMECGDVETWDKSKELSVGPWGPLLLLVVLPD